MTVSVFPGCPAALMGVTSIVYSKFKSISLRAADVLVVTILLHVSFDALYLQYLTLYLNAFAALLSIPSSFEASHTTWKPAFVLMNSISFTLDGFTTFLQTKKKVNFEMKRQCETPF